MFGAGEDHITHPHSWGEEDKEENEDLEEDDEPLVPENFIQTNVKTEATNLNFIPDKL